MLNLTNRPPCMGMLVKTCAHLLSPTHFSVDRGHPKDANGSTGAKNAVIALAITGIDNRGKAWNFSWDQS